MRIIAILLLAVLAGAGFFAMTTSTNAEKEDKFKRSERPIPNRFIVVLNDEAVKGTTVEELATNSIMAGFAANIDHIYTDALHGFSVEMSPSDAEALSRDPRVKYVEEDGVVEPAQTTQTNATWGISRIDQRFFQSPLDTEYQYTSSGNGVNVYVIDTGILVSHPEFQGRAFNGVDVVRDGNRMEECNGHGTHVAGTVGSSTYGVAKSVKLFSVKIFPCSGSTSTSNAISGIDWVRRHRNRPAVANMSFSGAYSQALGDAVNSLVNSGVVAVTAAGNNSIDACSESPAHTLSALTVGSVGSSDALSTISNTGPCIDLFAPGVNIQSTWNKPYQMIHAMSGTSTAAPHVAGVAALYLETNPTATPFDVSQVIIENTTPDILYNIGDGSPNRLVYSLLNIATPPPPPTGCPGTTYSGWLAGTRSSAFLSSEAGFNGRAGNYSGTVNVPAGTTLRFSLQKKQGQKWNAVAVTQGSQSQENILYNGRNGTYRWVIESLAGSGEYELCSQTP